MISQPKIQEADLWETWIEYDQFNPNHFGILYVMGEIFTDVKTGQPFTIRTTRTKLGNHLILTITEPCGKGRARNREVMYSEPIKDLNQYQSISIFQGVELLASFSEIEVLI
jgi:hypothetical protein